MSLNVLFRTNSLTTIWALGSLIRILCSRVFRTDEWFIAITAGVNLFSHLLFSNPIILGFLTGDISSKTLSPIKHFEHLTTYRWLSSVSNIALLVDKKYSLNAQLFGEKIDREKHELKNDIKAITLHMFKIEKTKKGYKSLVVVDV